MPTTVDTKAYVMGPAEVYYRAIGVLTPWTNMGATLDDAVLRVLIERFVPDNLSGVKGPVMGLDNIVRCNAEVEFTMPEVAGDKFALAVPGARITAAASSVVGGGLSTTTTAASLPGATTLSLTAATGAAVGDFISIDTAALIEYRQITAIASLDISFRDPLIRAHANGIAVVETTGDNRSLIEAPIVTRLPDSEYREWALVMQSGRTNTHELRLPRAVSTMDSAEVTAGDRVLSGFRMKLSGRYDGTNLQTSPFKLFGPAS